MRYTCTITDEAGGVVSQQSFDTPTQGVQELTVSPKVENQWSGGATIEVVLTNSGSLPISDPQLAFVCDGTVRELWGAEYLGQTGPEHYLILEGDMPNYGDVLRFKMILDAQDPIPAVYRFIPTTASEEVGAPTPPTTDTTASEVDLTPQSDDLQTHLNDEQTTSRVWGEENTTILDGAHTPTGRRGLRTTVKANTSSPSDNGHGGSGWVYHLPPSTHALLHYRLRFAADVDWVKGGKLPGLAGGTSPTGGADASQGFSARLMWREDGDGELYLYHPERISEYGDSLGRGDFQFSAGTWQTLQQEIKLNTFNDTGSPHHDGYVRLWWDDHLVLEVKGLLLRTSPEVKIDQLLYSVFFGGTGPEWRTPRDQPIDTCDYALVVLD